MTRREDAGRWLDAQRERRGLTVREMSIRLDVAVQTIYDWQNGRNTVSDERADQIAELFGMDIIEVRRGLGLWVPPEQQPAEPQREMTRDDILAEAQHHVEEAARLMRLVENQDHQSEAS